MKTITIKGHEISYSPTRQNFNRKAIQYTNDALKTLKRLGVGVDFMDHSGTKMALRKQEAWVSWYTENDFCAARCLKADSYVDNMQVLAKLLEKLEKEMQAEDIFDLFSDEENFLDLTKKAREIIGVDQNCLDIKEISQKYKQLAKETHPDMQGDAAAFKQLNKAYRRLKNLLE